MDLGMGLSLGSRQIVSAASGDGSLSDVLPSTVFDLDATLAASFTSGQKWLNIATAPADGSAQTDNDFFLGVDGSVSTDDPTFTGSAGSMAAYFAMDGGDFFNIAGGNTTFLKSLHKTTAGSDWWSVMTLQHIIDAQQYLFGTESAGSHGVTMQTQVSENLKAFQRGASLSNIEVEPASTLTAADTIIMTSHSHSTNVTRSWINTSTGNDNAQTYSTSTTDPTNSFKIGSRGDATQPLANGARMYSFAMGNEFLDDTGAAALKAALEARRGIVY